MIENLKHRYALSDKGARQMVWAFFTVTLSNLVLMLPVALMYYLASYLLQGKLPEKASGFGTACIVILLLILFTTYLQYKATFYSTYVESGVRRRALAEKLRKLPLSFFSKKDLSDLTHTIMTGCATIETASSHWIPERIGAMMSTTIVVIGLFFFNWKMAFVAVWVMPIAFIIVLTSRKGLKRVHEKTMADRLSCEDGIQEALETIRDLRSNNMTERYMQGLIGRIKNVEKNCINMEFQNAAYVCSAQMILKLGIGTVAVAEAALLMKNEINALTFFAFLLVVTRMYEPMQIALQNLSALIGPSGGGKTTVSRLAARFWDSSRGQVTVGGMDVSTIDPERLLSLYSIIFQDVTLFNNTVMENIRIGKKDATDEEVMAAARFANCMDFVEKLPDGMNTMIGENGANLSGGERQRISIARAFLKDAPIILMDEATASLDVDNESVIQETLSRLINDKTVLIIAHRMRSVAGVDKIVVLKDGSVAEQESPDELYQSGGIYHHMVNVQLQSRQ